MIATEADVDMEGDAPKSSQHQARRLSHILSSTANNTLEDDSDDDLLKEVQHSKQEESRLKNRLSMTQLLRTPKKALPSQLAYILSHTPSNSLQYQYQMKKTMSTPLSPRGVKTTTLFPEPLTDTKEDVPDLPTEQKAIIIMKKQETSGETPATPVKHQIIRHSLSVPSSPLQDPKSTLHIHPAQGQLLSPRRSGVPSVKYSAFSPLKVMLSKNKLPAVCVTRTRTQLKEGLHPDLQKTLENYHLTPSPTKPSHSITTTEEEPTTTKKGLPQELLQPIFEGIQKQEMTRRLSGTMNEMVVEVPDVKYYYIDNETSEDKKKESFDVNDYEYIETVEHVENEEEKEEEEEWLTISKNQKEVDVYTGSHKDVHEEVKDILAAIPDLEEKPTTPVSKPSTTKKDAYFEEYYTHIEEAATEEEVVCVPVKATPLQTVLSTKPVEDPVYLKHAVMWEQKEQAPTTVPAPVPAPVPTPVPTTTTPEPTLNYPVPNHYMPLYGNSTSFHPPTYPLSVSPYASNTLLPPTLNPSVALHLNNLPYQTMSTLPTMYNMSSSLPKTEAKTAPAAVPSPVPAVPTVPTVPAVPAVPTVPETVKSKSDEEKKSTEDKPASTETKEEVDPATLECSLCHQKQTSIHNKIILCMKCNTPYHKKCVGLSKLPTYDWYCETCQEEIDKQLQEEEEKEEVIELTPCQVCHEDHNKRFNQLFPCVRCHHCYHKKCAGLKRLPPENWECSDCKRQQQSAELMELDPFSAATKFNEMKEMVDDDLCMICHKYDYSIYNPAVICDTCQGSYHQNCLNLNRVPRQFMCPRCQRLYRPRNTKTAKKNSTMLTPNTPLTIEGLSKLTVVAIRSEIRKLNGSPTGLKEDLVKQLYDLLQKKRSAEKKEPVPPTLPLSYNAATSKTGAIESTESAGLPSPSALQANGSSLPAILNPVTDMNLTSGVAPVPVPVPVRSIPELSPSPPMPATNPQTVPPTLNLTPMVPPNVMANPAAPSTVPQPVPTAMNNYMNPTIRPTIQVEPFSNMKSSDHGKK